jgi:tetratricopeptide (TPR) repeat protein
MNKRFVPYIAIFLLVSLLIPLAISAQGEDALVAFREGRFQDAIRITTAEITANPANMDSYAVQGWALLALGRWSDAADLSQRGLQLARYDHRLIAIMGEAQYRLGNYLAALPYLQEYTAIRPEGAIIDDVYALMAEVHASLGEYHHADMALSASLHFAPGSAENWARLGAIREEAGDRENALAAYERALELNGNLATARQAASRLRAELGG